MYHEWFYEYIYHAIYTQQLPLSFQCHYKTVVNHCDRKRTKWPCYSAFDINQMINVVYSNDWCYSFIKHHVLYIRICLYCTAVTKSCLDVGWKDILTSLKGGLLSLGTLLLLLKGCFKKYEYFIVHSTVQYSLCSCLQVAQKLLCLSCCDMQLFWHSSVAVISAQRRI